MFTAAKVHHIYLIVTMVGGLFYETASPRCEICPYPDEFITAIAYICIGVTEDQTATARLQDERAYIAKQRHRTSQSPPVRYHIYRSGGQLLQYVSHWRIQTAAVVQQAEVHINHK